MLRMAKEDIRIPHFALVMCERDHVLDGEMEKRFKLM